MLILSVFSLWTFGLQAQDDNIEIKYQVDEIVRKETEIGLANNNKDDFIQGIKSPYEDHLWYYSSRDHIKAPTDFYKYNIKTGAITKIFDAENSPVQKYSLVPFAFGKDEHTIFLEAFDYAQGDGYHLGIWKYHIITKEFTAIEIDKMYMGTPLMGVNRENLYYPSTTESTRDLVHGGGNISYEYSLEGQTNNLLEANTKFVELNNGNASRSAPNCLAPIQTNIQYYFPYASGQYYCVGRLGNTPPCPNGIPNSCQGTECPHGNTGDGNCTPRPNIGVYIAMDVSNSVTNDPIHAAAFGRVTHSGWISGYGNSVEIQHIDGYYTFYAHLDEVLVAVDSIVHQLTVIGKEGNTGESFGEHLHFEVRSQSGVRGDSYVEFAEFNNQVPNYGNNGNALPKPPPITFVSNVDLLPICTGLSTSTNDTYLFTSGLVIENQGDELSGPYTIYYTLKNGSTEVEVGDISMPGLDAFSTTTVTNFAMDITSVPPGNYQLEIYVETDDFANNPNPLSEYDLFNNDCFAPSMVNISGGPTCYDGIQNQGETGVDCGGPCLPCTVSTCGYTVTNNTDCEVQLLWYTGVTYVWGSIIPPFSTGTDQVQSGVYQWWAYNTLDFSSVSTSWTFAYCSSPYGALAASACAGSPSCNFTLQNNTNCEVQIFWTDNEGDYWNGAIISPNSSAIESIDDGDAWSAYNTADGSLITPSFEYAWCDSPFGTLNASACGSGCNFTLYNNTDCEIQLFWTDNIGNYWNGAIVSPNSSAVESINNGDAWSAYNTADGSLITPYFEYAWCDNPSGTLAASACSASSCDPDGNFSGTYTGSIIHHAENYISAPGSGGSCNIQPSANVSLKAGNYIVMKPGFHAKENSVFLARIEECNTTMPLQSASDNGLDIELAQADKSISNEILSIRNYPNPFNQSTTIEYHLQKETKISIRVFNASFKEVALLVDDKLKASGTHSIEFNGSEFSPGMYFYSIQAGDFKLTQKMILVR